MLDALEKQVGYGIPIQELFDLVIGTSTGTTTAKLFLWPLIPHHFDILFTPAVWQIGLRGKC